MDHGAALPAGLCCSTPMNSLWSCGAPTGTWTCRPSRSKQPKPKSSTSSYEWLFHLHFHQSLNEVVQHAGALCTGQSSACECAIRSCCSATGPKGHLFGSASFNSSRTAFHSRPSSHRPHPLWVQHKACTLPLCRSAGLVNASPCFHKTKGAILRLHHVKEEAIYVAHVSPL